MSKATSLSTTTINHAKDAGRIVHQKAHNIHHSCAQPKFPKPAITGSIKKEHPPPTDAHAVQIGVDALMLKCPRMQNKSSLLQPCRRTGRRYWVAHAEPTDRFKQAEEKKKIPPQAR